MTQIPRDRAVDVARLGALLVVMFGHCALLLATIDGSGVRIGNLIGAQPSVAPLTWIAQVMPLFFFAGGAAGAYGYRAGTAWGAWLVTRAQRLYRPVFWYLAAWSVGLLIASLTLGADSAIGLGGESVALLWFLGVYVLALAFVPVLVRVRTGRGVGVVVAALIGAAAALDALRLSTGLAGAAVLNFLIVWLIPVVLGVAYARGLLDRRVALGAAVAAFLAQLALVVAGPYDVSLVVTGAENVSNVAPPTVVLAMHCVWMSCAFAAAAAAVGRWARRPRVWAVVAAGNAGAMTLYLWHIVAIAIAAFALHGLGLDAYDVTAPGFWGLLAVRAAVFAVVMLVLFRVLTPLERRPLPWWDAPVATTGGRVAVAGALTCGSGAILVVMAKFGLGDAAGWSALAAFVALVVGARICAAAPADGRVAPVTAAPAPKAVDSPRP
ncbi:acyltransferase family protein [Mycobacterium sp. smrl_JER01]|uniref:acyltransferase family protein n=1 Tax=Mycobacterium sp. smrl_JER01 TaxID=3402633 RepID=UPI003ABF097A